MGYHTLLKQDDDDNPYLGVVDNLCHKCFWYDPEQPYRCAVFPEGIPVGILIGQIDHTRPYTRGEVTDQGLTFFHRQP